MRKDSTRPAGGRGGCRPGADLPQSDSGRRAHGPGAGPRIPHPLTPRNLSMLSLRLLLPAAAALALLVAWRPVAARAGSDMTERARRIVKDHESRVRPLDVAVNLAWWNANTSGKAEDFARKEEAQNR